MGRRLNSWIVAAVRPPLVLIGFVSRGLYRLLFSGHDAKLAREHEERLAADIQNSLPFVFREMGGLIVPNDGVEFPPPFDYAVITVEASDMRLRFTRGRDHLAVQVAPKFSPNSWHELSTILSVLETPAVKRGSVSSLTQVGELMQQHMNEITKALTKDEYPSVKARLMELYERDRIVTKQLETEINRKIYG